MYMEQKNKKSKIINTKLEKVEESDMPRLQVNPEILKNLKSQNQARQYQELQVESVQKNENSQDAMFAIKFFTSGAIIGVLSYFLLPYLWRKYIKKQD